MAQNLIPEMVRAVIALFIVVDPLGNIPIFISLTRNLSKEERRRVFNTAGIVAFIIAIGIVLGGQQILNLFGIGLYSIMIAGGILLAILSIKILVYGGWVEGEGSEEDLGAVPIAFPLLVGPGAITTLLVYNQRAGIMVSVISVLIVMAVTRIILQFIDSIYRILGRVGSAVVARLMAVFIAAIAVEFMIEGIKHSFP
ncbi:MAG: MarC family protein [Candidatus Bathyarchaeia archaeon]|nr:MarC family protein [Candidatus Bathyarchaeota archaeon]